MPILYDRHAWGLSKIAADAGIPVSEMDGSGGGIVVSAVAFAAAGGLPPNNSFISIQLFPFGDFSVGVDHLGNISAMESMALTEPPKNHYSGTNGQGVFEKGFFGQKFRATLNIPAEQMPEGIDITIQIQCSTLADFVTDPGFSPPVTAASSNGGSWDEDEEKGEVTISWEIDDPTNKVDHFLIEYSWDNGESWWPWASALGTDRTYTDIAYEPNDTLYRVIPVDTDTSTVQDPDTVPVVPVSFVSGIEIEGDINIDISIGSEAVLQADPSGLYTLVPGKHTDTLYDRVGEEDTIVVQIPRPFFKTGYMP